MRYTLSHLAQDVKRQTGATDPLVDWYPLSALGVFADLVDLMKGPAADWGAMKCGCHPNCGIGTVVLVDTETRRMTPIADFFALERFLADVRIIGDASRGQRLTRAQLALALLRNFEPRRAPLSFAEFLRKFDKQSGGHAGFDTAADSRWRITFIAGMWFQDLFNYDFRRTEMCIVPYGTQMGEISFCAYNTGVGWRQIIENRYMNATTAQWYKTHGKHEVHASGKDLRLPLYADPVSVHVPAMSGRPRPAAAPVPAAAETHGDRGCHPGCRCA